MFFFPNLFLEVLVNSVILAGLGNFIFSSIGLWRCVLASNLVKGGFQSSLVKRQVWYMLDIGMRFNNMFGH